MAGDRSSPDNSGRRTRRKRLGSVNQHCVAEDGHAVAQLCNKRGHDCATKGEPCCSTQAFRQRGGRDNRTVGPDQRSANIGSVEQTVPPLPPRRLVGQHPPRIRRARRRCTIRNADRHADIDRAIRDRAASTGAAVSRRGGDGRSTVFDKSRLAQTLRPKNANGVAAGGPARKSPRRQAEPAPTGLRKSAPIAKTSKLPRMSRLPNKPLLPNLRDVR